MKADFFMSERRIYGIMNASILQRGCKEAFIES